MRLLLLGLGVLVLLAGCASLPFGGSPQQDRPVTVVVNNSDNVTHTFEVSVVAYRANATVRRDDGLTGTTDIGPELRSHSPGENHSYTAVELPSESRLHGRYTLDPGDGNESAIEEFGSNRAVVVTIHRGDDIVSWVSAHCDGVLAYLEVKMRYYGSDSAYNCLGG